MYYAGLNLGAMTAIKIVCLYCIFNNERHAYSEVCVCVCVCVSCVLTARWLAVQLRHRPRSRYVWQLVAEGRLDGGQRQTVLRKTLPHDETRSVHKRIQSPHWETLLEIKPHRKDASS